LFLISTDNALGSWDTAGPASRGEYCPDHQLRRAMYGTGHGRSQSSRSRWRR